MLTLKPRDVRPAYKNPVTFDHQAKTKSIEPHSKNKSFSARTQKRSQFRSMQ